MAVCSNEQALATVQHSVKCVLPHCTEFDDFPTTRIRNSDLAPLFPKRPGDVYVGFKLAMITPERIDFDLLHAVFTRYPRYQFIFIGGTNRPSLLARMKSYPNFHHIPELREDVLASVLHQLDVAIVPELDNDYTRGCDGTKILDYLACGVPVLSTTSPNEFGESVHAAEIHLGIFLFAWKDWCDEQIARTSQKYGMMVAQKNSWCNRVPQLMDWMFEQQREQQRGAQTVGGRLVSTMKAYL